ncbi:MAG TPA: hypothetical protein VMN60_11680 [Longimicrobiales bacterium]|nr:hypothetical protein [Longimicrobiales bacterium]
MTRFEKITVYSSTIAVAATGFAYAGMKYLMEPADEWAIVNHPLQPWILKLHILAAPVLVFAIGLIAARHILPQLRARVPRTLRSGMGSALIIIPMILSGYLLQAATSTAILTLLGYIHLAAGAIFTVTSIAHARAARRKYRESDYAEDDDEPGIPLQRRAG